MQTTRKQPATQKTTISFRISKEKCNILDTMATLADRDRSYLINQAINDVLEFYQWQIGEAEEGRKQIKAGKIATKAEIKKAFRL